VQISKEVRSGQYRLISFFLARQLVSIPFETAVTMLFTVIIYYMIGFQAAAAKYFIFTAVLLLVNLISDMVGFINGVILKVRTQPISSTVILCIDEYRAIMADKHSVVSISQLAAIREHLCESLLAGARAGVSGRPISHYPAETLEFLLGLTVEAHN